MNEDLKKLEELVLKYEWYDDEIYEFFCREWVCSKNENKNKK